MNRIFIEDKTALIDVAQGKLVIGKDGVRGNKPNKNTLETGPEIENVDCKTSSNTEYITLRPRSETIITIPVTDKGAENKNIVINKQEIATGIFCGDV